jgi:hypothetical protein
MNILAHILIFSILALGAVSTVASDNTTIFKAGPFNGSIDLGHSCEINVTGPYCSIDISGANYSIYNIYCDDKVFVQLQSYKDGRYITNPQSIKSTLIENGADRDTIRIVDRVIDGINGYAGEGYAVAKGSEIYRAVYGINSRSACWIGTWQGGHEDFLAALASIHVDQEDPDWLAGQCPSD